MSLSEDMDKVESAGKESERARKAANLKITLDALFKNKCDAKAIGWLISVYIGSLINVSTDEDMIEAIEKVYQERHEIVRMSRMAERMVLGDR